MSHDEIKIRPGLCVLTGQDACGKTTQAELLRASLVKLGAKVVVSSEPSGGDIGTLIRSRLASGDVSDPVELALMFSADRAGHLRREVEPAIADGHVVVMTRYAESTVIYQGLDPRMPTGGLVWAQSLQRMFRRPDICVVLGVRQDVAAGRMAWRAERDQFDSDTSLQARVAGGYGRLSGLMETWNVECVSSDTSIDATASCVLRAVVSALCLPDPDRAADPAAWVGRAVRLIVGQENMLGLVGHVECAMADGTLIVRLRSGGVLHSIPRSSVELLPSGV